MQNFVTIQSTDTLANSRQEILNNDLTIMSCSSGTSFPTTNLQIGMFCLRTDLSQLYQLKDLTPTWVMIFDLTKVFVDKAYVDAQDTTKVNTSQVVAAAAANKILQLDASGNLPTNITGNAATATTASASSSSTSIASVEATMQSVQAYLVGIPGLGGPGIMSIGGAGRTGVGPEMGGGPAFGMGGGGFGPSGGGWR